MRRKMPVLQMILLLLLCGGAVQAGSTPQLKLKLNVTSIRSGDYVQVSFSGVDVADRAGCLIGLWTPADANTSTVKDFPSGFSTYGGMPNVVTYPDAYVACTDDPDFNATGSGTFSRPLLAHRGSSAFIMLFDALGYGNQPRTAGRSPPITFTDVDAPSYGHIARVAGQHNAMRVMWQQSKAGATAGGSTDLPRVRWGTSGGQLTRSTVGGSRTYTKSDLCGGPANKEGWVEPGVFFDATLQLTEAFGVKPGTPHAPIKLLGFVCVRRQRLDLC